MDKDLLLLIKNIKTSILILKIMFLLLLICFIILIVKKENSTPAKENNVTNEKISQVNENINNLTNLTNRFINILKIPNVRGNIGEEQLKFIFEFMGMIKGSHFVEQERNEDGSRPDFKINLPNNLIIPVDAKFPFESYIGKFESGTDDQVFKKENLKSLKNHVNILANRHYNQEYNVPFTILFLPFERIVTDAIEADSSFLQYSMDKNIIICTPTTITGLLKIITLCWEYVKINENQDKIKKIIENINKKNSELMKSLEAMKKNHDNFTKALLECTSTSQALNKIIENF